MEQAKDDNVPIDAKRTNVSSSSSSNSNSSSSNVQTGDGNHSHNHSQNNSNDDNCDDDDQNKNACSSADRRDENVTTKEEQESSTDGLASSTVSDDHDNDDLEEKFAKLWFVNDDEDDDDDDDVHNNDKKLATSSSKNCNKSGSSLVGNTSGTPANKRKPGQILDSPTVESAAEYIKSGKCRKVIFMVGAGISTSAGIPDFRSPETGLFSQLEKYKLPYPEAVFDIGFFKSNPKPFYHLARELFPGNFTPTPCHYFMKLLHDKGILLRLYTQNIDSLERLAGVPGEKLIESHGTFHTAHCINKRCGKEFTLEWMKRIVLDKNRDDNVARCDACRSYVKPDIIFYGEMLPERFYTLIETDFRECDLLIVMGTSLTVQPFASLVDFVGPNVPRLMINLTKPEGTSLLSKLGIGAGGGLDFDSKKNVRNVFMKSDTDSGCRKLAQLIGWQRDLESLIECGNNKDDSA